jgi:hypothetical protein
MSITAGVGIAGGFGLHKLFGGGSPATTAQARSAEPVQHPASDVASASASALQGITLGGPMLLHVRDVASAEVAMMVGTRELIYRDPELVSRLITTAQSAKTTAEG